MQSLKDQLLKAGLVTAEDAKRAEEEAKYGKKRPQKPAEKPPEKKKDKRPQPARPTLAKRSVDLSNPVTLKVLQAIEAHRFIGDTQGELQFYFTLRDGRVRKLFVNAEIQKKLEAGELAIVENGDADRHIIVGSGAVAGIREADPDAVRFVNDGTPEPLEP